MKAALSLPHAALPALPQPGGARRVLAVLFVNELRAYLRNRVSVFWVFVFPLLLYGLLSFAVGNDLGQVSVAIAAADDAPSQAAAVRIEGTLRSARHYRVALQPSGAPADLVLHVQADARRLHVVTDSAASRSAALYLALRAVDEAARAEALALAAAAPAVEVEHRRRAGGAEPLRYDHFLFGGVIVLIMLSGGVLSLAYALAGQREQNALKAHATWPLPPQLYLAGVVGARLVLLVLAAGVCLLLGQFAFGLEMVWDPPRAAALLLLLLLGSALFLSLGFCLAARSGSVAATEMAGNAVYYPLLLLGDLTLPLRELPGHVDRVLQWMPTNQLAAGLRTALFDTRPYEVPWLLFAALALTAAALAAFGAARFRFVAPQR